MPDCLLDFIFTKITKMLSRAFNKAMNKVPRRNFTVMAPEVKTHLLKLGITNKNIVYNPRYAIVLTNI